MSKASRLLLVGSLFLVGCSGVDFGGQGDGSSVTANGSPASGADVNGAGGGSGGASGDNANGTLNQGTDVSNAGGPGGPINGNGNSSSAILPKLQFIGPPCMRQTNCAITFRLDKMYASQTEFDWHTDDTLYGSPVPNGQARWGRVDYEYVSTRGHVVFAPGQLEQTVYVRNINPENVAISIGVIMNACSYGGFREGCAKFFVP